jgi:methyl-accepting chemotaxis protein
MPILVQICIVISTLAMVAVAIALVRTFTQLRATAEQVERTMAQVTTTIPEIERTVVEARELLDTLGSAASRVDGMAREFASTGERLARASSMVVGEVVEPAIKVAALVKGVRAGASALAGTFLKRRGVVSTTSNEGGNHHE